MRPIPMLALALTLAVCLRPLAAPAWAPDRSIGEGHANRLVLDGSRICAATAVGVYCRDKDQDAWHLAYLEGQYVEDLVRTRLGWVAIISEPDSSPPSKYLIKPYFSRDGGARWVPGDFPLYSGLFGQQAFGDSLVRNDVGNVELSKDGGATWSALPPPPGRVLGCTLPAGTVLCATDNEIIGYAGTGNWMPLGTKSRFDQLNGSRGRIYSRDSLGVLSVYGSKGLERRLSPLAGLVLFVDTDSLLIAASPRGYAFVRGRGTDWTLSPSPYAFTPFQPGGVWKDNEAIFMGLDSPWKARIEGGKIVFEPHGQGIPNLIVRRLYVTGRDLFVVTNNAIWRNGVDDIWKPVFRSVASVSQSFFFEGMAMVNSLQINGNIEAAAPPIFSSDSGKTWQDQPASLPGFIFSMARMRDRFLAITYVGKDVPSDPGRFLLYEADAWMGPWMPRTSSSFPNTDRLAACGPRLFTYSSDRVWTSPDTGKIWTQTKFTRVLEAGGDRIYAVDSAGALWEAEQCVEPWTQVPVPWKNGEWPLLVNQSGGEPLLAVYDETGLSRIYPLPGASSAWRGVEAYPVPGIIQSLVLRENRLYASVLNAGLYVLDMRTDGVRPRASDRPSGNAARFSGWRRVDGRAMAPGAAARSPLFR